MDSSVRLFSVRGIDIKVHVTFPLILIWAGFQFGLVSDKGWSGALFGVIVTLLLFGIVILHELGHSFMALEFDVPITQIVLLPIGGVAQMGRMPDKPSQEFLVAIAGPAVNFVLAILLTAVALVFSIRLSPEQIMQSLRGMGSLELAPVFSYVFATNIFLGVFNLLPAFPMDGGRVLRALLASRLEYGQATSIAVTIGQGLAWLMGLWGFLGGGFFLILIAIFIYIGASQEGQTTRLRIILGDFKVRQAYTRQAKSLSPEDTLQQAIDLTLRSFQANFPVCDGDQLVGILTQQKLVDKLQSQGPQTLIRDAMVTDFKTVRPDDGLFSVQQELAQSDLEAIPVVQNGEFLGLITQQDIAEIFRLASSQSNILGLLGSNREDSV
ncbi:MAG: site-2 protease family protein [Anaerolineales bacterium]